VFAFCCCIVAYLFLALPSNDILILHNPCELLASHQHGPSGILLADLSAGDWLGGLLYSVGQQANEAVQDQLSALSFTRFILFLFSFHFCCKISTSLVLPFSLLSVHIPFSG
jgi:hypothetical protein